MALAVPRVVMRGGNPGVALPQPLTPSDAARVRRIFALQDHGDIPQAIRATEELDDPLLVGTILAERYLGRWYRTSASELSAWLAQYPELPDAPAIRALLMRRDPRAIVPRPTAEPGAVRLSVAAAPEEDPDEAPASIRRNPALDRAVQDRAQRGDASSALRLISTTRTLSQAYAALLRAEVAQVLFTRNEDTEALRIVLASLGQAPTDSQPGLTAYIGGLAAWRLGRPDQARILFEESARAGLASPRQRAASAFWAGRGAQRMGDARGAIRWLRQAAEQRRTFHGLIARRMLGLDTGILPTGELPAEADVDAVATTEHGWRAFALLQVGQTERAAAEFRVAWSGVRSDPTLTRSLILVAASCGLANVATDFASDLQTSSGHASGAALPRLRPAGGFTVDPALVYGLTRLESNFDAGAVSAAGARGLMQIMPATAQYVAGDLSLSEERLHDPSVNLAIGQRYVTYLAAQDGVGEDLLRLLASYNAGPGNLQRWNDTIRDGGDPMLFIEAIPNIETRQFVPQVLAYTWIYAARLHVPAPSLDELAGGEFPRFTRARQERTVAAWVSPPLH
mgnify:CR=1 FL=1